MDCELNQNLWGNFGETDLKARIFPIGIQCVNFAKRIKEMNLDA